MKKTGVSVFRTKSQNIILMAGVASICYKCGSTDTDRPFQSLLECLSCGAKLQADINGAMNIAIKLIISFDEASLDQWLAKAFLEKKYSLFPAREDRDAGRRNSRTKRKDGQLSVPPSPSPISRPTSGVARALPVTAVQASSEHVTIRSPSVNHLPVSGGRGRGTREQSTG